MAKRRFAALLCAVGILMVLPSIALAAQNATGEGLVPCGVNNSTTAGDYNVATQCEACNLVQLVQNIIMFLIGLSIPIAMAMFSWAGILYFTSGTRSENISKAKGIFKNSLIGFLVAISAWLIVNTVLYTVISKDYFPGSNWFHIDCSKIQRTINETLGNVLVNSLGIAPQVTEHTASPQYSCKDGYELITVGTTKECVGIDDPGKKATPTIVYDNPTLSRAGGSCSSFTSNTLLSCISSNESSCNPAIGSSVDIGADGNPVSWGLTQWNLSANPVNCTLSGGTSVSLNCPSAFNKAYTSSYHGTKVTDQSLFDRCVQAAQDPKCNLELAQTTLRNNGGSIAPWGAAVHNNCQ